MDVRYEIQQYVYLLVVQQQVVTYLPIRASREMTLALAPSAVRALAEAYT